MKNKIRLRRICYNKPMSKERIQRQEGEKIEKIRIPDKDMPSWIEVLRNGGLDDEQIDEILAHLNKTYARQKEMLNSDVVEEELHKLEKDMLENHGRTFTKEQKDYLKKGIESRFKK